MTNLFIDLVSFFRFSLIEKFFLQQVKIGSVSIDLNVFIEIVSDICKGSGDVFARCKLPSKVVMITGDNPLTACHVSRVLRLVSKRKPVLILDEPHDQEAKWRSENHHPLFSSAQRCPAPFELGQNAL